MANPQMLDQEIDKELLQNGIKENANMDLETNLNSLIHILGSDSVYDKIKEEFETIAKNVKAVIGNENKMIKLYKESKRKYYEVNNHCSKLTAQLNEERSGNFETQKKTEVVKVKEDRQQAKQDVILVSEKLKDDIVDEGEIEQLNKEKTTLKLQLEQSINNNEKLEREKAELLLNKDHLEKNFKTTRDENVNLREEFNLLSRDKEMTNKKVTEWEEKYSNLKSYSDERLKDIDKQKLQLENLQRSYEDQSRELLGNKKAYDGLKANKEFLDKNQKILEGDISDLREQVALYREKEKNLQLNVKKLEKEREILKSEINKKNLDVMERQRNIDKNNKEKEKLIDELEVKNNEIRLNIQEFQRWKREVEEYKNEHHKAQLKIKNQEGILTKKDGKINELVDEVKQEKGNN